MGLSHEVENGDVVDVVIYKNKYPETESYTKFDKNKIEIYLDEQIELILNQAGYDENWNTVFYPCENAVITVRALGLPMKNTEVFWDVRIDSWYAEYVSTAYEYGIVNGISENQFNPNGTITKQQACTMIARTAKLCGVENNFNEISVRNVLAEFTDYLTVSNWAKSNVAFCFENNLLDRIEWVYTCDLGKDVGGEYSARNGMKYE